MNGINLLREHYPEFDAREIDCRMFAIRNEWFKLIWYEGKKVELFDLTSDPNELVDLAATKPKLADEMLDQLKSWMASLTPGGAAEATVEINGRDLESINRLRALGYIK